MSVYVCQICFHGLDILMISAHVLFNLINGFFVFFRSVKLKKAFIERLEPNFICKTLLYKEQAIQDDAMKFVKKNDPTLGGIFELYSVDC